MRFRFWQTRAGGVIVQRRYLGFLWLNFFVSIWNSTPLEYPSLTAAERALSEWLEEHSHEQKVLKTIEV